MPFPDRSHFVLRVGLGGMVNRICTCFQTRVVSAMLLILLAAVPASAQLRKINIAYTATSPYQAALIIAKEAAIFKKHNLDPQLILTPGGSLGFQAMMGGDVAMVMADGSAKTIAHSPPDRKSTRLNTT